MVRNLTISTVVIREQEPFAADHFRRASSIEMHDGILQTPFVDAVNVLCAQVKAHGLHVPFHCLQQGWNPHALFCLHGGLGNSETEGQQ